MISRRTIFFAVAALVCFALVPLTPGELRWVDEFTGGLGALWAVALGLEDSFGPGRRPADHRPTPRQPSPFDPPPRPRSLP